MWGAFVLSNGFNRSAEVFICAQVHQTGKMELHLKSTMLSEVKSRESQRVLSLRRYGQPTRESGEMIDHAVVT